jgi:hypothetical protein
MQAGFYEEEFGPLVVQLPESVWHFCVIRSVRDGRGWLNKKPVLEKFDVIANPVGIE